MRVAINLLILLLTLSLNKSCVKPDNNGVGNEVDVSFELPATIDLYEGAEYTFQVKDGKAD